MTIWYDVDIKIIWYIMMATVPIQWHYVNLCIMSDYVGHCVQMLRFWQATQWVWSPGIQVSWPCWAEIPLESWLSVNHVARYWKPGHCSKDCQRTFWNPSAINVNVSICIAFPKHGRLAQSSKLAAASWCFAWWRHFRLIRLCGQPASALTAQPRPWRKNLGQSCSELFWVAISCNIQNS